MIIEIKLCLLHFKWITTFHVSNALILVQQTNYQSVIECIVPSLKYQQSENIQFKLAISDYNRRGICWHELKQYNEALNDYNKASECNNKYVSAINDRASLSMPILFTIYGTLITIILGIYLKKHRFKCVNWKGN